MDIPESANEPTLSAVVIPLLKGVIYQENDPLLWSRLVALDAKVRDYVRVLDLDLVLDEAEGYAFLRARDAAAFNAQHDRIAALKATGETDEADLENRITNDTVAMRRLQEELATVSAEIDSLKARRSNIPSQQIAIREALCQALDVTPEDMPFAGELLQVRPDESAWEGAAGRLLHNFGLPLLVPDEHYAQVVDWVDRTHLRGRLVYFRIRSRASIESPDLHPESIVRKLQIRPDSPFYDWMERELAHRFDVACSSMSVEPPNPREARFLHPHLSRRTSRASAYGALSF